MPGEIEVIEDEDQIKVLLTEAKKTSGSFP